VDLELNGKLALITGASKGIGSAIATHLAREGCGLILVARNADTLGEAAEQIRRDHQVPVQVLAADLSRQEEVERVAEDVNALDILINNAGAIPPGALLDVDNARWRAAWDLKVFGFISLTRALYRKLQPHRGVIVNIIGTAGERFDPNYIAGSAGNAALMAFTRALGHAAPKDGMRVVGINPGLVSTDRMETMLRGRAEKDHGDASRWQGYLEKLPFSRAAKPEEIADAAAFLASPRSGYTTGTIVTIDGAAR